MSELQGQVKLLEDELALTRRKLDAAPRQMHLLEKCHAYKDKRDKGIAADAGPAATAT